MIHDEHVTKNTILTITMGLLGISLVIIVHELGHFLAARYFLLPVTTFSLGFGPQLFSFTLGSTIFQLCLLPIGGYVTIDQEYLLLQPYHVQMIVILAGIVFNIILSHVLISWIVHKSSQKRAVIKEYLDKVKVFTKDYGTFIGPVGIISIIGKSFLIDASFFLFILALISLNIGMFNLIPLPFFDGGKALHITLHALGII